MKNNLRTVVSLLFDIVHWSVFYCYLARLNEKVRTLVGKGTSELTTVHSACWWCLVWTLCTIKQQGYCKKLEFLSFPFFYFHCYSDLFATIFSHLYCAGSWEGPRKCISQSQMWILRKRVGLLNWSRQYVTVITHISASGWLCLCEYGLVFG